MTLVLTTTGAFDSDEFAMSRGGSDGRRSRPPARGIDAFGREAVDNHAVYASGTLRPVELRPEKRATLIRWVSERLDAPVQAPDLQGAGYRFLDGRLVTTPNGPAALFVYEGASAERLTVMVRRMQIDRNRSMSERSYGALEGVTWSKDGLGFSVVAPGRLDRSAARRRAGAAAGVILLNPSSRWPARGGTPALPVDRP